jgi:hypothetical protein
MAVSTFVGSGRLYAQTNNSARATVDAQKVDATCHMLTCVRAGKRDASKILLTVDPIDGHRRFPSL